MSQIKTKIEKIIEIDQQIKLLIQNGDFFSINKKKKSFFSQIDSFVNLRNDIRKEFVRTNKIEIKDVELKKILRRISSGDDFIADHVIKILDKSSHEWYELTDEEIDELASQELFSWIGPRDYIEGLIEIGVMVSNSTLPKIFQTYLDQARKCYAFQQYDAVNALSRIILEIALRDICLQNGFIKEIQDHKEFYKKYPPWKLISFITKENLKIEIKKFYYEILSPKIHGFESFHNRNVKIELRGTLELVEKLYETYGD